MRNSLLERQRAGSGQLGSLSVPLGPDMDELRRRVELDLMTARGRLMKWEVVGRRRQLAALHPIVMGWVYFPEWCPKKTPPFHWEITDLYMNATRAAIGAPVSSGKTTILTKLGTIWSVLFEDWVKDILIVSSAEELISLWIDDMARQIKGSEELHEDFGDVVGAHWGSKTLEFVMPGRGGKKKVHKFIRSVGRAGTIRGRRPDRILVDDPEDEMSVKSELQREDYRVWFWGALVNRLDEAHKRLTYIGTCLDPEAFLVELLRKPPAGWVAKSYAALDEADQSIWPEKWPLPFLQQRRAEIGEERFQAEFMNNPVRNWHQRIFDVTAVRQAGITWDAKDFVTMCIDPAFRRGGDAWAITVVAVDGSAQWKVLEAKKAKTGTEGWLEAMAECAERFPRLLACGIETGGGQGALEYTVPDFMRRNGISLPITWIKHSPHGGRKSARIAQLQHVINAGRMTIQPHLVELYREIEAFRSGIDRQEDHLLDSLAMHLELQQPRTPEHVQEETPDQLRHRRFLAYQAQWKEARRARSSALDRLVPANGLARRLERYG